MKEIMKHGGGKHYNILFMKKTYQMLGDLSHKLLVSYAPIQTISAICVLDSVVFFHEHGVMNSH
jgi:hypothetical protein